MYNVLPNGMHAEYTTQAPKAGKHVLCEKPMANSVEECEAMIAAAKETGRKLMVAYRCHFEKYNLKAIEICKNPGAAAGEAAIYYDGSLLSYSGGGVEAHQKLGGGGSLVDVGIYGLNATRYLTGEEPVSVTAQLIENKDDPRVYGGGGGDGVDAEVSQRCAGDEHDELQRAEQQSSSADF